MTENKVAVGPYATILPTSLVVRCSAYRRYDG